MIENGFIVLHRKITQWEWYQNPNTFCIFVHLLLTANYEQKKFEGKTIERGQRVASYTTLAKETGLSVQNVRTAINHLKSTGEVTCLSTPNFTVFTVVNYSLYQDKQQTSQQTTNKPLTNDQQTTNNNETKINKDNKDKQNIAPSGAKNKDLFSGGYTDF